MQPAKTRLLFIHRCGVAGVAAKLAPPCCPNDEQAEPIGGLTDQMLCLSAWNAAATLAVVAAIPLVLATLAVMISEVATLAAAVQLL